MEWIVELIRLQIRMVYIVKDKRVWDKFDSLIADGGVLRDVPPHQSWVVTDTIMGFVSQCERDGWLVPRHAPSIYRKEDAGTDEQGTDEQGK